MILNNVTMFASNDVSTIKIGLESLYKDVTSTVITNEEISVGYSENNLLIKGTTISAEDMFYIKSPMTYFVRFPQEFNSYEEAKAIIDLSEYSNGVVGYDDDNVWSISC